MRSLIKENTLYIMEGVKEINNKEFYGNEYIEYINFPDSLQIIGEEAFSYCHNIKEIILPNNVKEIRAGAFFENTSLKKVILNEGLIEIYDGAFLSCCNLNEINIPYTLKKIPTMCFYGCGLQKITLEKNIIKIDDHAFWDNQYLKEVNILNKDAYLGKDIFGYCLNLKEGFIACGYPEEMELADFIQYTLLALTTYNKHSEKTKQVIKEYVLENEKIIMERIINTNNNKALNTLVKEKLLHGNIDLYLNKTLELKCNELTSLLLQVETEEEDFTL